MIRPNQQPKTPRELEQFFRDVTAMLGTLAGIPWNLISKAGSRLDEIAIRTHVMLQEVKGWTPGADTTQDRHISDANGKVWQDHVDVVNGNPHGTDHAMLDAIGELDPTSADATKDKHLSNAQGKVWQDHVGASQDVHGIGAGNSVVGTGTVQTLTNKKFGGVADYSEFEADGTLKFTGAATVWDDIQFAISSGRTAASNTPDWDTFTPNTSEYAFDVNDYIDLGCNEMAHWWKEGSTVQPHIHATNRAANATGANRFAKFTVWIAYAKADTVWTETSATAELTIPTGTAALTNLKLTLGDLDFTGLTINTQVKARIKRIPATGGTEYADHIFITQLGMHAEKDTAGSRGITTK